MSTLLERFTALFSGLQRAYGTYEVQKQDGDKRVGRAVTHNTPVTAALYERHLQGLQGLGIVPVNDEGECRFAAIDVDEYTKSHVDIVERIRANNFPIIPCLSKSGGVHLYFFFSEPVQGALVRAKLRVIADALGFPQIEIFPKQDRLNNPDEFGSWINLPFFGGLTDDVTRVMIDPRTGAEVVELEKFLSVAEHMRITASQLDALTITQSRTAPFRDGPPCIQKLCATGVQAGGRNNTMFQVGVYFRTKHKRDAGYGDGMLMELMRGANRDHFDPPMDDVEVVNTVRSVFRDKHFYRCEDEPMRSVCNKALCMTRKYGVGEANVDMRIDFGPLIKYYVADTNGQQSVDLPWYHWTLNGRIVRFDGDDLGNMRRFGDVVFRYLALFPPVMKEDAWRKFITESMAAAEIIAVPFEAGRTGQLVGHIKDFIRDYGTRYTWDALRDGGVYVDRQTMRAAMCWQDLKRFLGRKSVRETRENDLWEVLRKYFDGKSGTKSIDGRTMRYWDVKVVEADLRPAEDGAVDF